MSYTHPLPDAKLLHAYSSYQDGVAGLPGPSSSTRIWATLAQMEFAEGLQVHLDAAFLVGIAHGVEERLNELTAKITEDTPREEVIKFYEEALALKTLLEKAELCLHNMTT